MKKLLLIILLSTLPSTVFWNVFTQIKIWDITLNYISYDIASNIYNIKVGISNDAVSLSELSAQYNWVSSINGIFFCPEDYSRCNGLNYTINERFVDGEDLSFYPDTGERWVFWWDVNGIPFIHKTNNINPDIRGDIYEWVWNFPILFQNGQNLLENYIDNGLYDKKMKAKASRHFICSNKDKTHIYIWRSSATSLEWLTPALYTLWCWDALNLDAGWSSHLNYNGREIVKWDRKIIDGIIIQRKDIDVLKVEKSVEETMKRISLYISKYPSDISLNIIDILLKYIPKLRSEIYNTYSVDNYDLKWNRIGYSLEVTSLLDFKKVYTFNILERELKEFKKSLY
jgi:exopolysaccharide biosynthesis protein